MKTTIKNKPKLNFKYGFAKIDIDTENSIVVIEQIKVFKQRKGYGTRLINKIKKFARINNLKIELFAEPQDNSIDKDGLLNFYRNLGFEDNEYEGMFTY